MKKTADLHDLSVKIVNSIIDCIAPHLTLVLNKSLDGNIFPDPRKENKVVPLILRKDFRVLTNHAVANLAAARKWAGSNDDTITEYGLEVAVFTLVFYPVIEVLGGLFPPPSAHFTFTRYSIHFQ
ncbi:hypothetical protein EVAR_66517_1 [Eumeta japonica]|uniref:Uncharacterized protein n=1 Tax=Eumeta variegata TaxID=151549 RepID=A0A4C1ZBF8_EUMVA|nr:hypothetical protein EVAR_66517_1 [Eumeta japonica]